VGMDKDLIKEILAFRDNRDWKQFHNPKDLSISISIEASELLEKFQWSGVDLIVSDNIDGMKEELADILIYCVLLSDALNVDIGMIIREKLNLNNNKYSIKNSFGNSKKYTEFGDKNDSI